MHPSDRTNPPQVFHKLITSGPPSLESLYDCFLTVMSNLSPYIKAFSLPARHAV